MRFWQTLGHLHGQIWNASQIAASLGLTPPTMRRYLGILADTFMVRVLPPYHANLGKRLIKSPKISLHDSGLLHALLGIETLDNLYAHPTVGSSWEGMVIELLISHARDDVLPYFYRTVYRTVAGAELDLVLDSPSRKDAYEVKFGQAPALSRGYHQALVDLAIREGKVVYAGTENYILAADARVLSLEHAMQ